MKKGRERETEKDVTSVRAEVLEEEKKGTDEVFKVNLELDLYIYIFRVWLKVQDSFFFLHAVVVGDLVRLNEAALFTAFTSIT